MQTRMAIWIGIVVLTFPIAPVGAGEFASLNGQYAAPAVMQPPVHYPPTVGNAPPIVYHSAPVGDAPAVVLGTPVAAPLAMPFEEKSGGQFYLQAEGFLAWLDSGRVPPLVTTSPAGTPRAQAGVEGVGGNRILFGDHAIGEDPRWGFLLRGGYHLTDDCRRGFELGVIYIGREGETFTGRSTETPILARPFFNTQTGLNDVELIGFPGVRTGEVRVRTASDLISAEANYRQALSALCCERGRGLLGCGITLDLLIGYRGIRYRDKVEIEEFVRQFDTAGTTFSIRDSFYARNMFHGLQVGLQGRVERGDAFFDFRAMPAVGQRTSRIDVNGFTNINGTQLQGGLLAGSTNIGVYRDEDATFAGELGLKLGYRVTQNLSVTAGYTALYLGSAIRTGDLIDRAVNTTQLPPGTLNGPARPAVLIVENDIWAHALSLGIELRY